MAINQFFRFKNDVYIHRFCIFATTDKIMIL
uniref:Uncharacterized protein n=1 Tax=Siphoviridae sp. ct4085 TaxID=2827774 RepID=A0A8S5SF76_9CAUD|nr:MAG TPA: hypothetical protein [Siphoviridae sp. ct4085]